MRLCASASRSRPRTVSSNPPAAILKSPARRTAPERSRRAQHQDQPGDQDPARRHVESRSGPGADRGRGRRVRRDQDAERVEPAVAWPSTAETIRQLTMSAPRSRGFTRTEMENGSAATSSGRPIDTPRRRRRGRESSTAPARAAPRTTAARMSARRRASRRPRIRAGARVSLEGAVNRARECEEREDDGDAAAQQSGAPAPRRKVTPIVAASASAATAMPANPTFRARAAASSARSARGSERLIRSASSPAEGSFTGNCTAEMSVTHSNVVSEQVDAASTDWPFDRPGHAERVGAGSRGDDCRAEPARVLRRRGHRQLDPLTAERHLDRERRV